MQNYKIIGRAGEGAHGYVFKGVDLKTDRVVAMKRITFNLDSGIPKNTIREICSLRVLKSKNIVKLLDVTCKGSSVILVMEFLPCNLSDVIKNVQLDLGQIKTYTKMMLKGLAFIHENNIIHRDIKPANLLISHEGVLKIADFGLARIYREDKERMYSHQVATRWYRAPELLYGSRSYNQSIDVWSVGCILGEMFNRAPIFQGETDIEQLAIVLNILGTPTDENWPDLKLLPDYNKILFVPSEGKHFEEIIKCPDESALDLIKNILLYDGNKRITTRGALDHIFFVTIPRCAKLNEMPKYEQIKSKEEIFDWSTFDEIINEVNNSK